MVLSIIHGELNICTFLLHFRVFQFGLASGQCLIFKIDFFDSSDRRLVKCVEYVVVFDFKLRSIFPFVVAGQLEKLKVEQCKAYLRKNGLRLMGNKETLIQRIKEHIE